MSVILKEKITGPAAWKGPDIAADPAWLYHFTPDDIAVLDAALASFAAFEAWFRPEAAAATGGVALPPAAE